MILGKDAIIIDIEDAKKINDWLSKSRTREMLKLWQDIGVFDSIERLREAVRELEGQ